jgi:hypothetical protein
VACLLVLACVCTLVGSQYTHWSFQQVLRIPEAGIRYGRTPFAMYGRGFITLISGYLEDSPGSVYVHTTDDGYLSSDVIPFLSRARGTVSHVKWIHLLT